MAIRKLLVPLSGTAADDVAVATAARVAGLWRAHVLAVFFHRASNAMFAVGPDVFPIGMPNGMSGGMDGGMVGDADTERATQIEAARLRFSGLAATHGLVLGPAAHGAETATAEFVVASGREDEVVAQLARLADLTVVPHLNLDHDALFADALHAALFDSGRPVLIAPQRPAATIGRRIAIAWNGTAESASGVQAVMPWLKRAEAVRVLTATGYQRRGPDATALGAYLALHEVEAEIASFQPVEKSVGLGLLRAAGAFGADLLGMGAYSHSRWRQTILGGVTRSVLEEAEIAVLMSR